MYAALYSRFKLGKQLAIKDDGKVKTVAYRTWITLGDYKARAADKLHGSYLARLIITGNSDDPFWSAVTQGAAIACPYSLYSVGVIEYDGTAVPELVLTTKLENISIAMTRPQNRDDHITKQAERMIEQETESIDLAPELKDKLERIIGRLESEDNG